MKMRGRRGGTSAARQTRLGLATIAAGLVLALMWGYTRLSESRGAALEAAADLARCRQLAGRIEALRRRPAVADAREREANDLARRIERAAEEAEFPDGSIERIEPEPARRVGESPYKEKPTHVRLRKVTLRELFTFLHALSSDGTDDVEVSDDGGSPAAPPPAPSPGLRVRSIHLSAPPGEQAPDGWTVEATLAHLVYDPKAPAGSSGGSTGSGAGGATGGR
jgi:hypothetical protein